MARGQEQAAGWAQRFSVFGDLPTRALQGALRVTPWFLEPMLIGFWSLVFFVVAAEQRRAVRDNLGVLLPGIGRMGSLARAYLVFRSFAFTYVDAVRCEEVGGEVDWTIDGVEHFEDLAGRSEGCLILTAHMGNYDLAAPLFSGQFGRTVNAVRAPERDHRMQEIRERELRGWEARHPGFRVHYNIPQGMLALELAKLLAAGEVVAVQADRVLFDVSGVDVPIGGGRSLVLPRGPLVLARATGSPCFPLFIVRDGWRRYRVRVFPALELPERRRGQSDDDALGVWASALLAMVREHWSQWFVFERAFRPGGQ